MSTRPVGQNTVTFDFSSQKTGGTVAFEKVGEDLDNESHFESEKTPPSSNALEFVPQFQVGELDSLLGRRPRRLLPPKPTMVRARNLSEPEEPKPRTRGFSESDAPKTRPRGASEPDASNVMRKLDLSQLPSPEKTRGSLSERSNQIEPLSGEKKSSTLRKIASATSLPLGKVFRRHSQEEHHSKEARLLEMKKSRSLPSPVMSPLMSPRGSEGSQEEVEKKGSKTEMKQSRSLPSPNHSPREREKELNRISMRALPLSDLILQELILSINSVHFDEKNAAVRIKEYLKREENTPLLINALKEVKSYLPKEIISEKIEPRTKWLWGILAHDKKKVELEKKEEIPSDGFEEKWFRLFGALLVDPDTTFFVNEYVKAADEIPKSFSQGIIKNGANLPLETLLPSIKTLMTADFSNQSDEVLGRPTTFSSSLFTAYGSFLIQHQLESLVQAIKKEISDTKPINFCLEKETLLNLLESEQEGLGMHHPRSRVQLITKQERIVVAEYAILLELFYQLDFSEDFKNLLRMTRSCFAERLKESSNKTAEMLIGSFLFLRIFSPCLMVAGNTDHEKKIFTYIAKLAGALSIQSPLSPIKEQNLNFAITDKLYQDCLEKHREFINSNSIAIE